MQLLLPLLLLLSFGSPQSPSGGDPVETAPARPAPLQIITYNGPDSPESYALSDHLPVLATIR